MAVQNKEYLDYSGLKLYDEKIKALIKKSSDGDASALAELKTELSKEIESLKNTHAVDEDGNLLTVAQEAEAAAKAAVDGVIDGATEAFDTLKEIESWLKNEDGATAATILESLANAYEEIQGLKDYVDEHDEAIYDAIRAIQSDDILALFLEPVELEDGQTVAEAIAALGEEEKLVLTNNVDEELVIDKDCTIEAENVEFTRPITVSNNAFVNIIGATFSDVVKVQ